ncbi:MAG: hypothetical protein QM775_27580 [Pirellulales bacterium]
MILRPDQLDKRSDIYSLGCTLYYSVTGKVPFPGGTMRDKARAHCQLAPLDPRRLMPDLSDEFVEVVADLMAKRPEERVGSAAEVIERLEPWASAAVPTGLVAEPLLPPLPPPTVRIPASPLGDTEPYFLVQPLQEHLQDASTSQMSLGTHPSASFDETWPTMSSRSKSNVFPRHVHHSQDNSRLLMLVGAVIVVALLSAVAVSMIYTMLNG